MRRLALVPLLVTAFALSATPSAHAIVGGEVVPIERVPWQVAVSTPLAAGAACGGAILDSHRVVTAAHCVAGADPAATKVIAGTSNASKPSPGAQQVGVASIRVHPYYNGSPVTADDVAVVTTSAPLNLATPSAQPIALPDPEAARPPLGSVFAVSGYGIQQVLQPSDSQLRAAVLGPRRFLGCPAGDLLLSAILVCVDATPQAGTCSGDSGSPVTLGSPPQLIAVVSSHQASKNCGNGAMMFVDVTAPEIRRFIDGADAPPKAPRGGLKGGLEPQPWTSEPMTGQALVCKPGEWTENPQITYDFALLENEEIDPAHEPKVLQSGPSPRYVTTVKNAGQLIVCIVKATNAGGTGRMSGPPIDPVKSKERPQVRITSARCRGRRCTIRFTISEEDTVAGPSRVTVRIGSKRLKARRRGEPKLRKIRAVHYATTARYVATGRRPRGGRLRARVRAISAGSGLPGRTATGRVRG